MANQGASWWAERVAELAESGDAEGIARRYGVRAKTLVWWRSELKRRARSSATTARPRLLPVVVTRQPVETAMTSRDAIELVVDVGAARITMRGAVTPQHLTALVSAAARTC